jgi:toxin ParE1/3/4
MSSPDLPVILSPRANEDFADILLYGLRNWGDAQTAAYEAALDRALEHLGADPRIGRDRPDLAPGYRSLPVEQHVIYYHLDETAITVIGILHAKMNPRRHLDL